MLAHLFAPPVTTYPKTCAKSLFCGPHGGINLIEIGVPKGIRTPVTAVKGRCPGPLDDGDADPRSTAPGTGAEDYTPSRPGTTPGARRDEQPHRGPAGPR